MLCLLSRWATSRRKRSIKSIKKGKREYILLVKWEPFYPNMLCALWNITLALLKTTHLKGKWLPYSWAWCAIPLLTQYGRFLWWLDFCICFVSLHFAGNTLRWWNIGDFILNLLGWCEIVEALDFAECVANLHAHSDEIKGGFARSHGFIGKFKFFYQFDECSAKISI